MSTVCSAQPRSLELCVRAESVRVFKRFEVLSIRRGVAFVEKIFARAFWDGG